MIELSGERMNFNQRTMGRPVGRMNTNSDVESDGPLGQRTMHAISNRTSRTVDRFSGRMLIKPEVEIIGKLGQGAFIVYLTGSRERWAGMVGIRTAPVYNIILATGSD